MPDTTTTAWPHFQEPRYAALVEAAYEALDAERARLDAAAATVAPRPPLRLVKTAPAPLTAAERAEYRVPAQAAPSSTESRGIRCGHCRGRHVHLDVVRACSVASRQRRA